MKAVVGGDPDAALLARVGSGDEAAFRLLVAAKLPRVHGLARRLLGDAASADDVAQEALLRVWRQAGTWRSGQARFDTWLHRVVLNLCIDRTRRRREVPIDQAAEPIDPGAQADHVLECQELGWLVRDAVRRLPERQRQAITLHSYQDLSNVQIADTMGISVEALESLLSRARRSLRSLLEGVEP